MLSINGDSFLPTLRVSLSNFCSNLFGWDGSISHHTPKIPVHLQRLIPAMNQSHKQENIQIKEEIFSGRGGEREGGGRKSIKKLIAGSHISICKCQLSDDADDAASSVEW